MERDNRRATGFTLIEVLIASAICSIILAGTLLGAVSLQRTFAASEYYVNEQAQQLRFLDSLSLDLRRALTVTQSKSLPSLAAPDIIDLTLPDFYTVSPGNPSELVPRDPSFTNGAAVYGNPSQNPQVRYFVSGKVLYRRQSDYATGTLTTVQKALCNDVQAFSISYDSAGQVISTSVTFLPRYRWSLDENAGVRNTTKTYTNTLLRNTRQVSSTP